VAFSVGQQVCGRYEIREGVDPHPLGLTYRAFDHEIGIEVALRVIPPALLPDEFVRRTFIRQLGRARGLSHPNLVRFYDVACEGSLVVVALQWVPGPTVREALDERQRFTTAEARQLLHGVAAAIGHAHGHGVVLGDVWPEAILRLPEGVKLSSVGIGLALPRRRYLDAVRGTVAYRYLAPEIRNGLAAEPRADVYSLGALAAEVLSGEAPTEEGALPPLGGAAAPLGKVLARALAADPLQRHASVAALGQEIEAGLARGARARRRRLPPSEPSSEATRQVTEEELRQIQGQEVTRRGTAEEIFRLREQMADPADDLELEPEVIETLEPDATLDDDEEDGPEMELQLELVAPPEDELRGGSDTERVPLVDPDNTAPARRWAMPVEEAPPETAAPPPQLLVVAPSDHDEDEDIETRRIERIPSLEELAPVKPVPTLPVVPAPPRLPEARAPLPPPRLPEPLRAPPPLAALPSLAPRRSAPPQTEVVAPLGRSSRPPRRRRGPLTGALLILGAVATATTVMVALWLHLRQLERSRVGAEKQRLAEELNASAGAMRRTPPAPTVERPKTEAAAAAAPAAAAGAAASEGPCPLGARLARSRSAHYCIDVYEYPGGKTIPRTNVSFDEAGRLCALRGERLCSEREWEEGCRGKGHASYPYGQSFDPTRCNTRSNGGEIAPAGTFLDCRSAAGAYDMSGNVAEWVSSGANRGGSAQSNNPVVRCSTVTRTPSRAGGPFVGFRCCTDARQ
jgi:hypothetical protein